MRVDFLGVRGSVCAPGPDFVRYGGNTSCLAVSAGADAPPALLLDAGTGIRTATGMLDGCTLPRHHPGQPRALGPRAGAAVLRGR